MVEHVNIPNAHIHEPKGASTAPAGSVYTANGLGSGSWQIPATQPVVPTLSGAAFAQGRRLNNTSLTTITGGGVNTRVNLGTGFQADGLFAGGGINVETDGRFNNLSSEDRILLATANIYATPDAVGPVTYEFFFLVSGTAKFGSAFVTFDGGVPGSVSLTTGMRMNVGQWLELWVRAVGHTENITVNHANITMLGVS